ncbi:MAG: hypothetical protein E7028_06085 [Planctomycetaceae bacterium]|nr:hypothetical protein [Planctomycetaceae bacterium]
MARYKIQDIIFRPLFWFLVLITIGAFSIHPIYNRTTFPSYYYVGADTNGYTQYPYNIFNGEFGSSRTPLYPLFLKLVYWGFNCDSILNEVEHTPQGTPVSDHIVQGEETCFYVVCFQLCLYILTLIPFYFACGKFLHHPVIHFTSVLLIGMLFLRYQWWILTEPLAITGSLLFLSLITFYHFHPTHGLSIGVGILTFFLIMLRPVFIYLLPLLSAFWLLRFFICPRDRQYSISGILTILLVISGLFGYAKMNLKNHQCYTISTTALNNHFIIIFQTDYYLRSSDAEILEYISNSPLNCKASKYILFNDLIERFGYDRIKCFIHTTIKDNLFDFAVFNIKRMWWEKDIYFFTPLYFLIAFEFLIMLCLGIYFKQFPWFHGILFFNIFTYLFVMYFGGIDCYERLIIPVMPIAILQLARHVDLFATINSGNTENTIKYLQNTL